MLEHQHAVGGGDRDRTARATLTDDDRDHRHLQRQALLGRSGDGFGLPALLRLDSGKRSRRVDQSDDRNPETVGELHQADRLAIAFRLGHAEIVLEPRCGVVAFLMPDQHHPPPIDPREPADDRRIIAERAVAGQGMKSSASPAT